MGRNTRAPIAVNTLKVEVMIRSSGLSCKILHQHTSRITVLLDWRQSASAHYLHNVDTVNRDRIFLKKRCVQAFEHSDAVPVDEHD